MWVYLFIYFTRVDFGEEILHSQGKLELFLTQVQFILHFFVKQMVL